MTIDPRTGCLTWRPTPDQIGVHQVEVTAADNKGGVATQSLTLTVTTETFTMMTINFHDGINVAEGITEHDPTVVSLTPGTMSQVNDLLLPDVPKLFTFSEAVNFHFEYRQSAAVVVPETSVAAMAVVDSSAGEEPYEEIHADDLARLTFTTPVATPVQAFITVVFQRTDGRYFKIGKFTNNLDQWTVTVSYEELIP